MTRWRRRRGKQTSEPGSPGGPGSPAKAPGHSEKPAHACKYTVVMKRHVCASIVASVYLKRTKTLYIITYIPDQQFHLFVEAS